MPPSGEGVVTPHRGPRARPRCASPQAQKPRARSLSGLRLAAGEPVEGCGINGPRAAQLLAQLAERGQPCTVDVQHLLGDFAADPVKLRVRLALTGDRRRDLLGAAVLSGAGTMPLAALCRRQARSCAAFSSAMRALATFPSAALTAIISCSRARPGFRSSSALTARPPGREPAGSRSCRGRPAGTAGSHPACPPGPECHPRARPGAGPRS